MARRQRQCSERSTSGGRRLALVAAAAAAAALGALGRARWAFAGGAPRRLQAARLRRRALAEADLSEAQRATFETFVAEQVVDEDAMQRARSFPIGEEELIRRAKLYLALNQDAVMAPELLAEDFEFAGPIIGPLGKAKFIEQLRGFNFRGAFPDANSEWHHFRVDPFEPNRVWFTSRGSGTNTGLAPPLITEPTQKRYENPPQATSLRFNEAGEVNQYTIGYVMDRRLGNTGGLGGFLGILYAIDKPFPYPESQPYQPSWQRVLFNNVVEFLVSLQPQKSETER